MSKRINISFADDEKDLVSDYENKGKSKYIKYCMRFVKKFENKFFILPDGLSLNHIKPVKDETKNKMIKLIQK